MKVVVTGKGGVGKSTIAGTLARLLARRGHRVVALDCDPNPNLGTSLGLTTDEVLAVRPVLNALIDRGLTHHDRPPDPEELLTSLHSPAPDGVQWLATGLVERRSDRCLCCGSHSTTRDLFRDLDATHRVVIADLEAGLTDLVWASPQPNDVLLAVAEPTVSSIEVAVRACDLGRAFGLTSITGIANRSVEPGDPSRLAETSRVPVIDIPEDPSVLRAEELAVAPLDLDPWSPAMVALAALARTLEGAQSAPTPAG